MRRNLQAANASIHTYPADTYNQTELKGRPGKSVPMTRAGSAPFKTTDVWGVVAKHTKALEFPSNKNELQPLPGKSVPILRAPSQMYSAHTLARTMGREMLKPVKVAVVDPHERRAIIKDIHERLQDEYAAHYTSALNTRNVGVIHSMIESSSNIMAAKGKIPTDEIARHLARVPQTTTIDPRDVGIAGTVIGAPRVASTAVGPIGVSVPVGAPVRAPAKASAPEEAATVVGRPIGESVSEMGESFGPMLEVKHDVSISGEPFPLSKKEVALVDGYARTRSGAESGSIEYVSAKKLGTLLAKMSITPGDIEKRYEKNDKYAKLRYLVDINPDFRAMLLERNLTPDGVDSLIEQTGKGRQVGKGRKKEMSTLRSGMFGHTTHKKMVHQPTRSYRNQLT